MLISINKEEFLVKSDEYNPIIHDEFNNLKILSGLGEHERIISLLSELSQTIEGKKMNLICSQISHGGYIPIQLSKNFNVIEGVVSSNEDFDNLETNRKKYNVNNITTFDKSVWNVILKEESMPYILYVTSEIEFDKREEDNNPVYMVVNDVALITLMREKYKKYTEFALSQSDYKVYVHESVLSQFFTTFSYYLSKTMMELNYDNLLHLTMIIKNGGESLAEVIRSNLDYFDEYTILDTGSTDDTVNILKNELRGKKGKIYEEPFINFRDSRNRCLDLAGTSCKFIIMLDDTYMLKENLRQFLQTVRGDQFSDSFSLYIKSDDVEYGSNRIIKSATKLRYKYKLHEVITPDNNKNVIIPIHHGLIFDYRSDYMEDRTMNRKEYDLRVLQEMVEEDEDDSRAYYYLGQTYNLLHRHQEAFDNFIKRIEHKSEGFLQEKIDACFEAGRLANFQLNKPWEVCEALYNRAYDMDKTRPDSLYFLGIHHYLEGKYGIAYDYMKEGYKVGYPLHCQYSLKPTLSFYYLPKYLAELCYYMKDFKLGSEVVQFFLKHNTKETEANKVDYYVMKCWEKIYRELSKEWQVLVLSSRKPKVVFIVDGGFTSWTGSDILRKGMGGSETFIIEISKYLELQGKFHVVVFCKCDRVEEFGGVEYKMLKDYKDYIMNDENNIHAVIVSRYPEYLPAVYESQVKNVYLLLHDLIPEGEIILTSPMLRKVLCLSDYHVNFVKNMFPTLKELVEKFEYGIDLDSFFDVDIINEEKKEGEIRFIYSSFANRGLLYLLQMWRKIKETLVGATLYIHCDVENSWVNSVDSENMREIKKLLVELTELDLGIVYKGWTSKGELIKTWCTADVWFYTTTFLETFCLTALEAALSKTLAVTFPIGSLVETVGDRGLLLNMNVTTEEGQSLILKDLFSILSDEGHRQFLVEKNYEWALQKSWEKQGIKFEKLIGGENFAVVIEKVVEVFDEDLLPKIVTYYNFLMTKKEVKKEVLVYGKCKQKKKDIKKK